MKKAPRSATHASKTRKPVILQVIPWLDSGGVERGTVDISTAIVHADGQSLVAAAKGRLVGDLEENGGLFLPFSGKTKNPISLLWQNVRVLEKMIHDHGVDLVHARSRAPAWSAYLAARRTGTPFVTTYHGAYGQKNAFKAFYNSVMAKGDVVIANSKYTARLVAERNPAARSRIVTIYRGVDMAVFDPEVVSAERCSVLARKWGLDERPVVILPSRLTRWKGQSFILPVMAAIKAQSIPFQLVLIGDEQGREAYVSEIDGLIARHDLGDCVSRVGYCGDMPAAYALADLVIVPSQDAETFGRSAAESLAMGKPVLVGDLGAQPEVVACPEGIKRDEWIGAVQVHDDETAWREAIIRFLALPNEAKAGMARQAREQVRAHFSLQSMASQTLAIYDRLLEPNLGQRFTEL